MNNSQNIFQNRLDNIQWKINKHNIDESLILSLYQAYRLTIEVNLQNGLLKRLKLENVDSADLAWESIVSSFTAQNDQFEMAKSLLKYNTAWFFGHTPFESTNIVFIGTHRIKSLLLLLHLNLIDKETEILSLEINQELNHFTWYYDSRLDNYLHDPLISYEDSIVINGINYYVQKNQSRKETFGYYTTLFAESLNNNPKLWILLNNYEPIINYKLKEKINISLDYLDHLKQDIINKKLQDPSFTKQEKITIYEEFIKWLLYTDNIQWVPLDNIGIINGLQKDEFYNNNNIHLPLLGKVNDTHAVVYEQDTLLIKELKEQEKNNLENILVGIMVIKNKEDFIMPKQLCLTCILNNYVSLIPYLKTSIEHNGIEYIKLPYYFAELYLKTVKDILDIQNNDMHSFVKKIK